MDYIKRCYLNNKWLTVTCKPHFTTEKMIMPTVQFKIYKFLYIFLPNHILHTSFKIFIRSYASEYLPVYLIIFKVEEYSCINIHMHYIIDMCRIQFKEACFSFFSQLRWFCIFWREIFEKGKNFVRNSHIFSMIYTETILLIKKRNISAWPTTLTK
jgi:hypothetical protein